MTLTPALTPVHTHTPAPSVPTPVLNPAHHPGENFLRVNFDGDVLALIEYNTQAYVGMKAIVTVLGLNWSGQYTKLCSDIILGPELVELDVTTLGGTQKGIFLPLKYLSGYLFKINPSRINKALQNKIIRYQRECYEVLNAAFNNAYLPKNHTSGLPDLSDPLVMAQTLHDMTGQIIVIETQRRALHSTVEEMKPKVEVYDAVMSAENTLTVGQVAKALGMTQNALFKQLRDDKILINHKGYPNHNLPYAQFISDGYFSTRINRANNNNYPQTLVTPKGLDWLTRKYGLGSAV